MSKIFSCQHTLNVDGNVEESNLVFSFNSKEILNSNSLPKNTYFLSKKKKLIRETSAYYGSQWHKNPFLAENFVDYSNLLNNKNNAKISARKEMNKDKIDIEEQNNVLNYIDVDFKEEIDNFESFFEPYGIFSEKKEIAKKGSNETTKIDIFDKPEIGTDKINDSVFMFDKCSVYIGVSPPTSRRCDPPNYYPTVKPLIDGLTDSLWWKDDNFEHLKSMSFYYVQPNKEKEYLFFIKIKRHKNNELNSIYL